MPKIANFKLHDTIFAFITIQTNEVDQRLHPIIIISCWWGFNQYPSKIFASWLCFWIWHINSLVHVIQASWCFFVIHDIEVMQTTYTRINFTGNGMLQTLYISYFTEVLYSARITVLHQIAILRSMILCTFFNAEINEFESEIPSIILQF